MSLHTRDAQPAFECFSRPCQSADDDAAIKLLQHYLADHVDNLNKFSLHGVLSLSPASDQHLRSSLVYRIYLHSALQLIFITETS